MNNISIAVDNLSKRYQLGTIGYGSLQQDIRTWWARIRGQEDPNTRIGEKSRMDLHGEFWALRDLTFSVQKGDRVGILGRNGAGKSTLLKLLSRVTSPTTGSIKLKGRVASLLEVGTGFHPELTGRENVYLNGAILGMKRHEIQNKFDEIVEFAGVSQFIDTPVKRYSSGMYVRLAFSVAAHLDSETLIVDEVLAVGDAEFQKKCLGKMEDISVASGKTVLFVSHNVASIQKLCNRGLVLESGRLAVADRIEQAVSHYSSSVTNRENLSFQWEEKQAPILSEYFRPRRMFVKTATSSLVESNVLKSDAIKVRIEFEVEKLDDNLNVGIEIYELESFGTPIFLSTSTDAERSHWPKLRQGTNVMECLIPAHFLNEGVYRVELIAFLHLVKWIIEPNAGGPAIRLEVLGGISNSPNWLSRRGGYTAPVLEWTIPSDPEKSR